ncbi:hypothetical protein GCWU000341_02759 [Oribacterium sp. oral taxon 078 str. F0262]|nr:hypothetical protein GCWU000341_02759 [Oribacterium sp. oral taxon 078 str. F0262]
MLLPLALNFSQCFSPGDRALPRPLGLFPAERSGESRVRPFPKRPLSLFRSPSFPIALLSLFRGEGGAGKDGRRCVFCPCQESRAAGFVDAEIGERL